MSTTPQIREATELGTAEDVIISADSHVMEPPDLWQMRLPPALADRAPRFPDQRTDDFHPGGGDSSERVKEMAVDGVSAEVLYPTLGLGLFGLADAALQQACFRVYNDWLIEYARRRPTGSSASP